MTISEELARLEELRRNGSLTETEYEAAKQKALNEDSAGPAGGGIMATGQPGQIHGMEESTYCVLMHLSQLLTYSGLGVIAPVVMWIISKDQSEMARRHGAAMMNWLVSSLIYKSIAGLLCLVFIGFPILMVLILLDFVFPIVAAVKVKDEVWSYPMAIRFFEES